MIQSPTREQIDFLVQQGLKEDLGPGDVTTGGILRSNPVSEAEVTAKEPLVLCGVEIFKRVFTVLDSSAAFPGQGYRDGQQVPRGETILRVKARCRALLEGERTALNILQRLSGISTLTRQYVEKAGPVTVLDTRKTTPGLRVFEKYAVRCGGGNNHRFGLFDAVLIKDNHIKAAGGIRNAVDRVRKNSPEIKTVEVETTHLDEVDEALAAGADVILLDNMPLETIRRAVERVGGKARIEVSGSVSLERLGELASTGIDFVSVGALTHSARAVDITMNILEKKPEKNAGFPDNQEERGKE
ncbi:MAG: carboxylating nicotinate-nucleotide diphosphorylase [Nitrospinaceae bacterium]